MNNNLTDITLVVDRSGSMSSCRTDAEGGINTFVEEQKKTPGDANITLVQFNTDYEVVHNGIPVKYVPKFELHPRGCTALLDAVGKAINTVGERLAKMSENDRPGCVVFVIVTDGQENASKEFSQAQIKELVEKQKTKYNWKFTFLGANVDAFGEAINMGIALYAAANYNVANSASAYSAASGNVSMMRCCSMAGDTSKDFEYTDKQRLEMVCDADNKAVPQKPSSPTR